MKQYTANRIWNTISAIVLALLILAEAVLLIWLGKLNMLPGLYFGILAGVCAVITGLLSLMLFRRRAGKWQKKQRHTRQVVALLLCIVMMAGSILGILAVSKLYGTISSITNVTKINVLLEVYVRSDDPAQYIQDTADYTFALADTTEAEDAGKAVAELEKLLNTTLNIVRYPTAFDMIDALYAGEVGAIILDTSYISVMDSLEGYSDFTDRARAVHEYVIEKEVTAAQSAAPAADKDVSNTSFLVYISGNDARKELLADGGSDVNILVAVNPQAKQILLVNTPRDYYVANPAGNGDRDKLSHCGLNGIQNCIGAITGLYGQEIDYYARINFTGFKTLVDAIGGVTVYSDVSFSAGSYTFQQGENHLNGSQALAFARERKSLAGGDNDRGKNQMKLISGIISQLSAGSLLANYADILDSLEGMFSTNMPAEVISELVQLQLSEMPSWDILSLAVTGDNGNDTCWAVGGGYGYVMYPHEDEVAFASGLITRVLNGEVLTQEDLIMN